MIASTEWDLRSFDGKFVRLKRRLGETDDAYAERRQHVADQAATHRTFLHDPDEYEVVEVAGRPHRAV